MVWSHSVFRDVGVPLLIVAPSGRISSGNPAAQELVGRRSLSGTPLADLVPSTDRTLVETFLTTVSALPPGRSRTLGPLRVEWAGRSRQVQLTASRSVGEHGFDAVVVAPLELLVTAVRAEEIPYVLTDPLTGVGSRIRGLQELEAAVSRRATGCLLLVDLDAFEEINRTFSVAEGDRILREIAQRLERAVPAEASVARIDGDMFLVVSPTTPAARAEELARVVLAAMARPMQFGQTQVVTASLGAASLQADRSDDALIRAQRALAVAKDQGGNQVVIDGPQLRTYGRRHADLEAAARIRALESDVARARLEARTDALTQVANMRSYHEEVPRLQSRLRRAGGSAAALFLDLDEFGSINRSLGQHRGDMALQAVAAVLADTCRTEDLLFRVGGEEFVVLLPDTDLAGGLAAAERLRAAVESAAVPHWGRPDVPIVTVSIGVAAGTAPDLTVAHVVRDANEQMRLAKSRGRNQISPQAPHPPEPGTGDPAGHDAA